MWESENQDESPLMTTDNFHGIDRLGCKANGPCGLALPRGLLLLGYFSGETVSVIGPIGAHAQMIV